jgi:MOSC domain-containing protein YiiM
MPEVVAVSVGVPQRIRLGDREVASAIIKEPVKARVRVRRLGIDGDGQADTENHGGVDQAVYAYPVEHYDFWAEELGRSGFPHGQFGENLTLRGLREEDVRVGDILSVGSTHLQVTQPRIPCAKLAWRMDAGADFAKRFLASARLGFYLRVLEAGELGPGDPIEIADRDPGSVSVAELIRVSQFDRDDAEGLKRVLASRALSEEWRVRLQRSLKRAGQARG